MTWSTRLGINFMYVIRVSLRANEADGEKGKEKNTGCQSSHPSRLCLNHVIDSNTAEITDSLSLLTRVSDYDVFEEIRVRHGQPVLYQPVLALLKWLLEAKTAGKVCVIYASAKPALFSSRREGTINTSSSNRSTSHVPPSPRTQNRRGCGLHRKFTHLNRYVSGQCSSRGQIYQ